MHAQSQQPSFHYTISMEAPSSHQFHLTLKCTNLVAALPDFKMPAWMPGYYQILDYAKNVSNFHAKDATGNELPWSQSNTNTWRVAHTPGAPITITYDVTANKNFVALPWLDSTRAYIAPAGIFLYVNGLLNIPVTIKINPAPGWDHIATGLEPLKPKTSGAANNTFQAENFDILFDCPILIGNLDALDDFTIQNIPHHFIGYKLGEFDRKQFIGDLKKITQQCIAVIGDIPYNHYTFIAIDPLGRGGIEHLNSTTIGFSGESLNTPKDKIRTLTFIAHEYFHHYNVKRIRPLALGPFDYERENITDQLWVSEGLSVYYEYLTVKRAGLMSAEELYQRFSTDIAAYENKPGHLYQSLARASEETWSEGPFGRSPDSSISYYQKGPAIGLLFDFAIRHHTANKKSLDNVMQTLYREYYQKRKRGFTGSEFRQTCESIAGADLSELFEYVYTTKEPDYAKYLAYGGLGIDKDYKIHSLENVDAQQVAIRKAWLKD